MDFDLYNRTVATEMLESITNILLKGLTYEKLTGPQQRKASRIMEHSGKLKEELQDLLKTLKGKNGKEK